MTPKIVIGPSSFAEADSSPLDKLKAAGFIPVSNPYKRKITKDELKELLTDDVVGILAGLEPLDREVLSQSKLRCVSRVGAGISNVDLQAAKELNIPVFNTPDGPTTAVAELVIGALISLLRRIPPSDEALHHRRWERKIGGQIEGKIVAIVGLGRIGRRVAELLTAFRARVIAVDPYAINPGESSWPLLTLEEALERADVVTVHVNGDECVLNEAAFAGMKRGVWLLNAARGAVVSERALINAIDEGIVAGAWMDTFETEPYEGALCDYRNVILTPHIGSYTAECRLRMEEEAVDHLLSCLRTSGGHER